VGAGARAEKNEQATTNGTQTPTPNFSSNFMITF